MVDSLQYKLKQIWYFCFLVCKVKGGKKDTIDHRQNIVLNDRRVQSDSGQQTII